jgi:hypothetical protein
MKELRPAVMQLRQGFNLVIKFRRFSISSAFPTFVAMLASDRRSTFFPTMLRA